MDKRLAVLILAATALWAGCSGVRWYGSSRDLGPEAAYPPKDHSPVRYYTDLGPDEIDVSSYPEEQRRAYALYARACSQCHGLARSISAPYVDRASWDFYLSSMRIQTYFRRDARLSESDLKAILDFLVYDAQARKIARRAEFEQLTTELQKRYTFSYLEREATEGPAVKRVPR